MAARRRGGCWAALGAAFLAFELAVDLSVALVAQCLLFGWADAATAWWCLRQDSIRSRGWMAAGLHVASALLKVGFGAFGVVVMAGAITSAVEARDRSAIVPARGDPPAFVGAVILIGFVSMLAAWGLANLTCGVALWKRRKLWLGPEAGLARVQSRWPPWAADESNLGRLVAVNRMNLIVGFAVIPWMTTLILVVILGLGSLVNAIGGDGAATVVTISGMIVFIIAVPALGLCVVMPRLGARVVASSPIEAWELEAP